MFTIRGVFCNSLVAEMSADSIEHTYNHFNSYVSHPSLNHFNSYVSHPSLEADPLPAARNMLSDGKG
jgi:hypothetical protein